MENFKLIVNYNNNKPCPVCGSDMKRDTTDNPHTDYVMHYTCCNQSCNISAEIRN